MRGAIVLLTLAVAGCAPRQYTLMRDAGRELLLPPGVRKAPPTPETECKDGVPATPRASHYAVHGCYVQAGFVDWQPGMRLKIVKPVLASGEKLNTEVAAQSGLSLTVKSNVAGVDIRYAQPGELRLGAGLTHFRLFFLARDLERGRTITFIGARSARALDAATHGLDDYCAPPGSPCLTVSEGTVIGAELPVQVQGKPEFVPLGATVREALPPGVDGARVRLTRLWRGKPVAVTPLSDRAPTVLGLPLNSGDSIIW